MRQLAGGLNRAWLTVIGLILLLGGALAAAIALGLLPRVIAATRAPITAPTTADPVVDPGIGGFFEQPAVAVGVGVVGLLLGILGLAWLLAQIPRSNAAKPFRLHDDATRGLTVCDPGVLTAAVEDDAESLPGVTKAAAVLRGTAQQPELTLKVTANDRADTQALVRALRTETAAHLATAMGTPLYHLAAQIDITTGRRTDDRVTL